MTDVLHAELPADLADELIAKGFEEFIVLRGIAADVSTIVTVTSAGLAVGANAATIIVARDALSQFVAAVRDWVRRKPAGELTIDVSARRGNEKTRLRLDITSENGTPEIDTAALTAFIESLFPDH
ncbi:MAG: hypothetical protein ABSA93_15165 [Streptosporangiaceae bacterium]|jgi:hypothetical protein